LGYSDEQYNKLLEQIAKKDEEIRENDKAITGLEQDIESIKEYAALYRDYVQCVKNWPVLGPLWDFLAESEAITRAPRQALSTVHQFASDLVHETAAKAHEHEIAVVYSLIEAKEKLGDANLAETKQKLDESTLHIEELTFHLTQLRKDLSDFSQYRRHLSEALELDNRIKELMVRQELIRDDLIEQLRRETLNHCVRQLQHSLAIKQETLSAATLQKGIIADLKKQIEDLVIEEEASKLLIQELSPTDGLIAEGLLGFIRNFTGQMNNLIRKIWAYPLQVKDCGTAGDGSAELTYKFPLMVQTKTNVVPDVKLGSTGMREIVDLAFKVIAMRYLGLSESPLYLDEFGHSFDEAHRNSAMSTIKALMEQQPFTQLFMVSHYQSSYGAFTSAQICVLCTNNITVPVKTAFNQHVTME
jgi:hypothetical protein